MTTTLKRVETKADWDQFIALPWKIYKGDPNWVPPLRIAVKDMLDVKKNPFFRHADMALWIALNGTEVVGRVIAVVDDAYAEVSKDKAGFFGFFEVINDQAVTNLLLDEAAKWLKAKGCLIVRGPMNPSTNHECGLLVEGFQDPPTVMMTYNPEYYGKLLENWGFAKSKDLLAYLIDSAKHRVTDKVLAHVERAKNAGKITFRQPDLSKWDQEIDSILEIYNDAWETNWGFVPMNAEEFRHMAKDMKMILDPKLLLIAEVRGKPAGFGLALPDVNQVFKKIPSGKLFPFGLIKLLWLLKGPLRKKTINRCRIITLGIKKEYRELGIGPLLYTEYFKRGPRYGYPQGEASWILEDNIQMNKAIVMMGGMAAYKRYRIYDKTI